MSRLQLPINDKVSWGINGKQIEGVSITSDSGDMIRQNMAKEDGINGPIIFQGAPEIFRSITIRCLGDFGLNNFRNALNSELNFAYSQVTIDLQGIQTTYYYWELQESNNENALDTRNTHIYFFTMSLLGPAPLGTMYVIPAS
jgi:hypothetical protein